HILTRIVEAKRKRLQVSRMRVPEAIVKRMAETAKPVSSFRESLGNGQRVRIIAEVKKTSPSKGVLREGLDPFALAGAYMKAGACAISVVTEEDFFQGDLGWINPIRSAAASLPVLRKDFVWEPFQVYETRAAGASAILLITAMLELGELRELIALSNQLELDVLAEVHDESELHEALEAGASIIGVNNRDLKTFDVSLDTSLHLGKLIPDDRLFVVESGIHKRDDVDLLLDAGADAFLIGEHLLTAPDPAAALRALL
ncbi:MAG TPA: indole-3-glycerol phosphate synthase TrpC, partial [Terriglobia bacterium]|nr:indole-3-glycerol phosphate synthase TrpC [Terriglobia bacterium]